jgi:hypothetical protein
MTPTAWTVRVLREKRFLPKSLTASPCLFTLEINTKPLANERMPLLGHEKTCMMLSRAPSATHGCAGERAPGAGRWRGMSRSR